VAACQQGGSKAPPAPSPGPGSARTADGRLGDAPPGDAPHGDAVLHELTAQIMVSSTVANPAIKPEHLIDHDFSTAWNSRTGQLAGAWISAGVGHAEIREIRMTVGHTGKGPKGEDYFTMNPRITRVSILDGGAAYSVELDPSSRALQTIAVKNSGSDVRVRVDKVVMGSRKDWRETCVSEFSVWGLGTNSQPTSIAVDSPPMTGLPSADMPLLDVDAWCSDMLSIATPEYEKKARAETHIDGPTPPICGTEPWTLATPSREWSALSLLELSPDETYGPHWFGVMAKTPTGWWLLDASDDCGHFSDGGLCKYTLDKAVASGGKLSLVFTIQRSAGDRKATLDCTLDHGRPVCE
ncbi:MAG TPA: hypothetical protein VGC41_12465, partial [Kofleriaceae bacterium]